MARRFAKVSEEEIEEAFFRPSDLVNTKTSIQENNSVSIRKNVFSTEDLAWHLMTI